MAERILIVDDDPGVQRFLRHALEGQGYLVLSAENGLAGLLSAQKERPDLTVLDVMLPGLDGLEVCHRLKSDEATAKHPVLMLSAKQRETDRDAGDRVGADRYLVKPLDLAEFLETVRDMLSTAVTDPLKHGNHIRLQPRLSWMSASRLIARAPTTRVKLLCQKQTCL